MAANATGEAQIGSLRLHFDRSVKLAFNGSSISSVGGLLLHRELDDALGLTDMAAELIADPRTGRNGRHRLVGFLRQSVFSRIAGYEDVNDADRLCRDPVMRQVVGGRAVKHGAASASAMGRFETEMLTRPENLLALAELPGRWIDAVHDRQSPKSITLDLDSSEPPSRVNPALAGSHMRETWIVQRHGYRTRRRSDGISRQPCRPPLLSLNCGSVKGTCRPRNGRNILTDGRTDSRGENSLERPVIGILAAVLVVLPALPLQAQTLQDLFAKGVREKTTGALAIFGMAALPTETASTLLLDTGGEKDDDYDFKAGQLGGGFTISDRFPLYLEGFLGWNRYDPVFLLSDKGRPSRLPLKWTNVSATGGIGWDFKLTDDLVLRPMVHISVGRVQTDLSVAATFIAKQLGLDASFLGAGGIWIGGGGASLGLEYNHRWESDYEVDVTLRHTHLHLRPVFRDKDYVGEANAITTALWSRLRVPTGLHLWDRPVRGVFEFSASYIPGDQGKVLRTDWLVQGGMGVEIDFSETWVPLLTTTRLTARYTKGERLEGFSIGLGASF